MTKKSFILNLLIFLFPLLLLQNCTSKDSSQQAQHNLGFEVWTDRSGLSDGWGTWGNQKVEIDSTIFFEGKYSGKISTVSDKPAFGGIVYKIPIKGMVGDSVSFEGKIRFENIKDGFVGLILRVERDGNTIHFDNLQNLDLHGTKDWENYRTTLPLGVGMDNLTVAGIIQGNGMAWFDDFKVEIDGVDIQDIPIPIQLPSLYETDTAFDQGSRIAITTLTDQQIDDLTITAKIWVFLKYHHPEVNAGKFNWDYELFRNLPQVLASRNEKERDETILKWIRKTGKVPKCETCIESPSDAFILGDIQWIERENILKELKESLKWIFENRISGANHYAGPAEYGPPPAFTNELDYAQFSYPDDGYRLLALFRYWGIIQYYFPYKHLIDDDWDQVLKSFIPVFLNAKNALDYELALLQLITKINDTHASLNTKLIDSELRGEYYPPFELAFVENKLVITKPLLDTLSHLQGEVISHFNGKEIHTMIESLSPYFPASNKAVLKRDMAWQILRSKEKPVKLTFEKKGMVNMDFVHMNTFNSLFAKKNPEKESFKMISNDIAYLNIRKLNPTELESIFSKIKSTKGLIIDLRTYPENTLIYDLGAYLVKTPKGFVKASLPQYDTPGTFYFTPPIEMQPHPDTFYNGKVILLVNENTQSTSEFHAMGFQMGDNVMTIGSQTAGADGNVTNIKLPGGYSTFISGVGIYYPDGTETQRIGIKIDMEVIPTIQGIKNGRDEVMEKAIEILNEL